MRPLVSLKPQLDSNQQFFVYQTNVFTFLNLAVKFLLIYAGVGGFEPQKNTSTVTGWHASQLHHNANKERFMESS